jgi:flagellar assembly protein FliH
VREAADRETRARELGRQEGEQQGRARFEEQLSLARAAVASAISQFAHERATYYQKLEEEVVQLALGIARQILHREAQVDPLLLAGIVRVALEKIEGATGVTLLLNPRNAADWRHYLSMRMEPADLPEIVEDAAIEPDRCTIRTSMGTAELGLEVQLKEIQQGLMDLLAARPPGNS